MKRILSIVKIILSLSHFWKVYYFLTDRNDYDTCKKAFVEEMNRKSQQIGMSNTHWINASGLGEDGIYSCTTARDLAVMGANAFLYPLLRGIWSEDNNYEVQITKPYIVHPHKHVRRRIERTMEFRQLGGFPILGGKTGAGDGYFSLLVISTLGYGGGIVPLQYCLQRIQMDVLRR